MAVEIRRNNYEQLVLHALAHGFQVRELSDGHVLFVSPAGNTVRSRRSGIENPKGRGRNWEHQIARLRQIGLPWPPEQTYDARRSGIRIESAPLTVVRDTFTAEPESGIDPAVAQVWRQRYMNAMTAPHEPEPPHPQFEHRYYSRGREMLSASEVAQLAGRLIELRQDGGLAALDDLAEQAGCSRSYLRKIMQAQLVGDYHVSVKLGLRLRELAEHSRRRRLALPSVSETVQEIVRSARAALPVEQTPDPLPASLVELWEQELEVRIAPWRERALSAERHCEELRQMLTEEQARLDAIRQAVAKIDLSGATS